jgi:probable F420-dependent oxidoreductase
MKLGACFPTNEIGTDPVAVRDWTQAAEDLGYELIEVYDHVLSHDPERMGAGWDRTYNRHTPWREPMVMLGYMAAITSRAEFLTGVLVLPMRQTALVAKQVAEIDLLSNGRMNLGVGIGWSTIEYGALGQGFHTRGRRSEEQIQLLRRLWSEEVVTFDGEFDQIEEAGINPRPERSIPIWLGGQADVVMDRIGRFGDGWVSGWSRPAHLVDRIARIRAAASAAGRDPDAFQFESRARIGRWGPEQQAEHALLCREAGVTHFSLHTLDGGLTSVQQHIDAMRDFRDAYQAVATE